VKGAKKARKEKERKIMKCVKCGKRFVGSGHLCKECLAKKMEGKDYSSYTNEFFDGFEKELKEIKDEKNRFYKKKGLTLLISAAVFGALALFYYFNRNMNNTTMYVAIGALTVDFAVNIFIVIYVVKKISDFNLGYSLKKMELIDRKEFDFFDDVFARIIADEIKAKYVKSSFHYNFLEDKIYPGTVIFERNPQFIGTMESNPFCYSQYKQSVVNKVVMKETMIDGVVIDETMSRYTTNDIEIPASFTFTVKKPAAVGLEIKDGFDCVLDETIKMDYKEFNDKFRVICSSDIEAYKYLTADVMEEILKIDKTLRMKEMNIEGDKAACKFRESGIDIDYTPSFSANIKSNREKYTWQRVYKDAFPSIENIVRIAKAAYPLAKVG
jgi:hypothetical protein